MNKEIKRDAAIGRNRCMRKSVYLQEAASFEVREDY